MLLCIAVGNPLRGDDGVAHRVLELIDRQNVSRRSVMQFTPELASDIAKAERVLFIDGDVSSDQPRIEAIAEDGHRTPVGHAMTVAEVVALARRLYGFRGEAFLCRVPVGGFEPGEQLSPAAAASARAAAVIVREFVADLET